MNNRGSRWVSMYLKTPKGGNEANTPQLVLMLMQGRHDFAHLTLGGATDWKSFCRWVIDSTCSIHGRSSKETSCFWRKLETCTAPRLILPKLPFAESTIRLHPGQRILPLMMRSNKDFYQQRSMKELPLRVLFNLWRSVNDFSIACYLLLSPLSPPFCFVSTRIASSEKPLVALDEHPWLVEITCLMLSKHGSAGHKLV